MTRTSRKTVQTAAEVLNKYLAADGDSDIQALLKDESHSPALLDLINEILSGAAEGGRLVAAVESNGTLLGYVPRIEIPIPERAPTETNLAAAPDHGLEGK